MGAEHRRNIGLHGAAGDLVRACSTLSDALERARRRELASWVQVVTLELVRRVVEGTGVEDAADRVGVALGASGGVLGPTPSVLRAEAALARVLRWWRFDPIRDGSPPRVVYVPRDTPPPEG